MLTLTLKLMCLMSVALKCLTFYSVIWKHEMVLGGVFSIIDKCAPPPPKKKISTVSSICDFITVFFRIQY